MSLDPSSVKQSAARILSCLCRNDGGSAIDQVYEHVRCCITSGALSPGERIPPTNELAALWGLPLATVHQGLHLLVKEGYIQRRQRRGTFVSEPRDGIHSMACYLPGTTLANPGSFYTLVAHAVDRLCDAAGLTCRLMIDPRDHARQEAPWDKLGRMAELGRVDAVIGLGLDFRHLGWLDRLAVPVAYFSSARTRNAVTFDTNRFVRAGMEVLCRQGCRCVGVISGSIWHDLRSHGFVNRGVAAFAAGIHAAQRRHGIRVVSVSPDASASSTVRRGVDHREMGYRMACRLLAEQRDMDGMLVYPDSVAQGVMCALLERRAVASIPRLVFHRNREAPFFCPLPVTWVESSALELAEALLARVRGETRDGKRIRLVDFRVVENTQHEGKAPAETSDCGDAQPTGRGGSS